MLIGLPVVTLEDLLLGIVFFFLCDSMFAWKSNKQTTISRSSAETEYRALTFLASEVTWIYFLLLDFAITPSPTLVFCDNQVAIYIATNPSFHE